MMSEVIRMMMMMIVIRRHMRLVFLYFVFLCVCVWGGVVWLGFFFVCLFVFVRALVSIACLLVRKG